MTLRADYQTAILTNTLYEIHKSAPVSGAEQLAPSIEVIGGAGVTIYGSQTFPASPPTGMSQAATGFTGLQPFGILPNYLYVQGSATSVVLSGVNAKVATA